MQIFKDRKSAGKLLAKRLNEYRDKKDVIVLGIPRGGVVVASEVARKLNLPLDIIVTRKIGSPNQEELALGAVDPDGQIVWDQELLDQLRIDNGQLTIEDEVNEIKRRDKLYRQGKELFDISNRTVILVDDGIATGSTTLAAAKYLRSHQAKEIILAVPVASQEALSKLSVSVDQLVVLETPQYFQAVGQFYHQFEPVTDSEVVQLLTEAGSSQYKKALER